MYIPKRIAPAVVSAIVGLIPGPGNAVVHTAASIGGRAVATQTGKTFARAVSQDTHGFPLTVTPRLDVNCQASSEVRTSVASLPTTPEGFNLLTQGTGVNATDNIDFVSISGQTTAPISEKLQTQKSRLRSILASCFGNRFAGKTKIWVQPDGSATGKMGRLDVQIDQPNLTIDDSTGRVTGGFSSVAITRGSSSPLPKPGSLKCKTTLDIQNPLTSVGGFSQNPPFNPKTMLDVSDLLPKSPAFVEPTELELITNNTHPAFYGKGRPGAIDAAGQCGMTSKLGKVDKLNTGPEWTAKDNSGTVFHWSRQGNWEVDNRTGLKPLTFRPLPGRGHARCYGPTVCDLPGVLPSTAPPPAITPQIITQPQTRNVNFVATGHPYRRRPAAKV